jgi:hypothetical protein
LEPFVQADIELQKSKQLLIEQSMYIVQYQSAINSMLASLEQVETYFGHVTGLIEDKKFYEANASLDEGKRTMNLFREQIDTLEQLLTHSMETAWNEQRNRANYSMEMIIHRSNGC